MRRSVPRDAKLRPVHTKMGQRTICVVDPHPEDYPTWPATAELRGLQLKFVTSAEEALRVDRNQTVDLWVVNADLPGLSGFDLCGMLRRQSAHAPVLLVTAEYSVEAEQAAWQARASMFGCKPAQHTWLHDFMARPVRRPARHAAQFARPVRVA